MCKCTPERRTPFCGAPGCEAPPQQQRAAAPKQYDVGNRDIVDQDLRHGGAYMRHVQALTAEALYSKSDIAAELAHRDILIDEVQHAAVALSWKLGKAEKALRDIDIEVGGCGPDCSKDFLRLALNSVRDIARRGLASEKKSSLTDMCGSDRTPR